jgi:hypothetical protein
MIEIILHEINMTLLSIGELQINIESIVILDIYGNKLIVE